MKNIDYPLDKFLEYSKSKPEQLMFVDFMASWCGPCKTIKPFIHDLEENYPSVEFLLVNCDDDEREDIMDHFNVSALPTFILIKNAKVVNSVLGIKEDDIENAINDSL